MKNVVVVISILTICSFALASTGNGGMSECLSLSMQSALDVYAETADLFPIPKITLTQNELQTPSNGIDTMITVGSKVTYYVIATPNNKLNAAGVPVKLKGCTRAYVAEILDGQSTLVCHKEAKYLNWLKCQAGIGSADPDAAETICGSNPCK